MTSTLNPSLFQQRKPASVSQLVDDLRKAVARGVIEQGEQLPTIRQMADDTGLTYNAVNRAVSILQAEGLLVSRKRAGTFVAGRRGRQQEDRSVMRIFALIGPELSTGFYPALQKGFDLAAAERGYQIITSNTDNDVRAQADTILQLMDKNIAGIAIVPATLGPSPSHHIRLLQRNRVPVVMLHRGMEGVQAPLITVPTEHVGAMAGRQLLERGHARIAYCASQRAGLSRGYERGLRRALAEAGVTLRDEHVDYGDMVLFDNQNYAEYEDHLDRWFHLHMTGPDRPTALFTSFESLGEIAYLLAMRYGLRVPEDLSILTIGGQERRGAIVRRLACVTINEQQAGRLTADLLDQMHRGERALDDSESFTIEIGFDAAQSLAACGSARQS